MKKILLSTCLASLFLAACSDNQSDNQTASSASAAMADICANPALAEQIKAQVQSDFANYMLNQVKTDSRGWFEATQLTELAKNLGVETRDAKEVGLSCQAQVSISVAQPILDNASKYAPLLNADTAVAIINNGIKGGNTRFDGTTLTVPLNYSVQDNQGKFSYTVSDQNLNSAVRLLSEALLPYGIADNINYNGKLMSKAAALNLMRNPVANQIASSPSALPAAEVEPIGTTVAEPPKAEDLADNSNATTEPEVMQPEQPSSRIKDSDLAEAKKANAQATQSIKSAWRKITPEIQETLVEEQRNWESKKRQSCRSAGAKGADASEIQYRQMECDTRLTRERIQYLNGFSIE